MHYLNMKKSELLFATIVLIVLIGAFFVGAQNDSNAPANVSAPVGITTTPPVQTEGIQKAEQCLNDQIKNKELSLQEAVFAMLAIGADSKLTDKIKSQEGQNCWPSGGCTLKDTSQVALAYSRIGKDTKGIQDWLTTRASSTTELLWYLEIDIQNRGASKCTITYDGSGKKINVNDDMKITGSAGSCFSISSSGYWLELKNNCFDKNFTISCDQDFVTSTLYQKSGGGTVYISPETHSASSLGTTEEAVRSKCFKTGTTCEYEGSLWAALALFKEGKQISDYLPYLLAFEDNNDKYFPSTFLYILTKGDDQYSKIVQSQKQNKFWEITGSPYNRYYDTSLAMLALGTSSATELDNSRNYLLSIQTKEGCWNNNNVRDTGFILYSGWPKTVAFAPEAGAGSTAACVEAGYYCSPRFSCLDAGGKVLDGYECSSFGDACCSVKVREASCDSKDGIICASTQQCSGKEVSSAEGSCCIGACQEVQVENLCETTGVGTCKFSCDSGETESGASCGTSGKLCCQIAAKTTSYTWLWILLIILIILAVVAIIYRNKIRVWVYKYRGKASVTPVTKPRGPPSAPGAMIHRPAPQFGAPRPPLPTARPMLPPARTISPRDREMEETLRKLREMTK